MSGLNELIKHIADGLKPDGRGKIILYWPDDPEAPEPGPGDRTIQLKWEEELADGAIYLPHIDELPAEALREAEDE